ncbi:hypothetical protein DCS_05955 [Drechmeria coniospora]|uniref:DUF4396 domain-containing protein n=1 Tax=Drechmeria coniospora TaxID=98403 RepID=A0A151GA96_DRECN|nr:hypothetical protein DCS_05955 [Drechmeria coniospora]KYK54005.1 hypothetical protein DCS_05955 [Drechmeria coniospora]
MALLLIPCSRAHARAGTPLALLRRVGQASLARSSRTTGPRCVPSKGNGETCSRQGGLEAQQHRRPAVTRYLFWNSRPTWRRAAINTLRCLVGCTAGDFSALWFLQTCHPELGVAPIMAISMASGLTTSMLLETVLLRLGRDKLSWPTAARTAAGMSLISMLTMEMAENAVDYHLTGGQVALDEPAFWLAATVSLAAGFLAPLPYNYARLRKHGKGCH